MASIKADDLLTSVQLFDPNGDPSSTGRPWQQWLKSFSLYADSKGLIIQAHTTKSSTSALCWRKSTRKTLADTGSAAEYEKAVNALNVYFMPKVKFDIPKSCLPEYGTA